MQKLQDALNMLTRMGFMDHYKNLEALLRAKSDVSGAVEHLITEYSFK